jgi:HEAT repeat protein
MKLLKRTRRPNVTALAGQDDLEGLISAASYQDVRRGNDGHALDRGAEIRADAVAALGELGHEAGNGTVTGALRDPSDDVRSAAVRVFYQRGEVGALVQALGWLPADRGSSRALALRALLELKAPGTAQSVIRALVWAPGVRPLAELDVALVHTLVQADTQADVANEVVEELLTALSDDREEVGDRTEEVLLRLAPASVQGVIAELEGGRSPERAASLLGRTGDTRALEPLIEALDHRDISVRVEAASALGELREPAAVEPLLRATRDHNIDVRVQAGQALDALGTAAVVIGISAMVGPIIAEAVASAVQPKALAGHGGATNSERPGLADHGGARDSERPVGLLGVGGFQNALNEARAAGEHSR